MSHNHSETISTLLNQPNELVDHICNQLPNPRDLLSLALTARRLYQLVIPDHLNCRRIRTDVRNIALWADMLSRSFFASKVVTIDIISTESETDVQQLIPHGVATTQVRPEYIGGNEDMALEFESRAVDTLTLAIAKMENLETFRWLDRSIAPTLHPALFLALRRLPYLTHVETTDNGRRTEMPDSGVGIATSPLWTLTNLTTFSYTTTTHPSPLTTTNLFNLLFLSKNTLQSITLPLSPTTNEHELHLAWAPHFPSLRRLSIDVTAATPETLNTFLARHADTLQALETRHRCGKYSRIKLDALTELRAFSCQEADFHLLSQGKRRLRHLGVIDVHGGNLGVAVGFLKGEECRCWLESLVISPEVSAVSSGVHPEVAEAVAGLVRLRKLAFRGEFGWLSFSRREVVQRADSIFTRLVSFLGRLPDLTHFSYIRLTDRHPEDGLLDLVFERLAVALPKLRYVEMRFSSMDQWYVIERSGDGEYRGWRATGRLDVRVGEWAREFAD